MDFFGKSGLRRPQTPLPLSKSVFGILFTFGLWAFLYINKKDPFFFLGEQGLSCMDTKDCSFCIANGGRRA